MLSPPAELSETLATLANHIPAVKAILENRATPQDADQLATLCESLGGADLAVYIRHLGQGVPLQVVLGEIATNGQLVKELQAMRANYESLSDVLKMLGMR